MKRWQDRHAGLARCISMRLARREQAAVLRVLRLIQIRHPRRRRRRRRPPAEPPSPTSRGVRERCGSRARSETKTLPVSQNPDALLARVAHPLKVAPGHALEPVVIEPGARSRRCSPPGRSRAGSGPRGSGSPKRSSVSRFIASARFSSKFGLEVGVGTNLVQILQPQPLRHEARTQRIGAGVGTSMRPRLLRQLVGTRKTAPRRRRARSSSSGGRPQRKNESREARSMSSSA